MNAIINALTETKPAKRYWRIAGSGIEFEGGRFAGSSPSIIAGKAAKSLWSKIDNVSKYKRYSKRTSIKFIIRETTRGSEKKSYSYEASREKLAKPIEYKFKTDMGERTVVQKYKYTVKECPEF